MKFLRTFFSNTEDEVAAVRTLVPEAPVFGSCVSHGPAGVAPSRIDLYRNVRPTDTGEPAFCMYERNELGQLVTDYIEAVEAATAVTPKRKRKVAA